MSSFVAAEPGPKARVWPLGGSPVDISSGLRGDIPGLRSNLPAYGIHPQSALHPINEDTLWASFQGNVEAQRAFAEKKPPTVGDVDPVTADTRLLAVPPPAPVAAAGAGGAGAAKPTFEELLVIGGLHEADITAGVLRRARTKYANAVLLAVQDSKAADAVLIYKQAELLPSTATVLQLEVDGYKLNGPLFDGSELTICYKAEKVFILKSLEEKEAGRIRAFSAAMAGRVIPGITPFELKESAAHGKTLMIMPKYPTTLEPLPYLSDEGTVNLWYCLSEALGAVHDLGFAHMDIKPSNICVSESASYCLIDLGSICPFNERSSSTLPYIPHDFNVNGRRASASLDWWMFAMTLAEKGCGASNGLDVGSKARSATMAQLRSHLAAHLNPAIWAALEPRLVG